jgi:hypothetical protein
VWVEVVSIELSEKRIEVLSCIGVKKRFARWRPWSYEGGESKSMYAIFPEDV